MALTVTMELPDHLASQLQADAQDRGVSLEAFVRDTILRLYQQDNWEWSPTFTDEERRLRSSRMLEREDLWGSEADEVWDSWTPSNPESRPRPTERSGSEQAASKRGGLQ